MHLDRLRLGSGSIEWRLAENANAAIRYGADRLAIESPRVMQSQTDVTPALVIFAFTCGFAAGGLLGALVAIPIAAALRVLTLTVAAPAIRRRGANGSKARS